MSMQPSVDHAKRARRVRAERALVLMEIRDGTRSLRDVLERGPSCVHEMEVYDLVRAVRGIGKEKCRIIFERAQVWPMTQVDELPTSDIEGILLHAGQNA